MIRINKNLVLFSGLFLVLSTILLLTVQKFSPLIGRVVYYCQSFIETQMIIVPYYLGFIPITLISLILGISIARFLILFFRTQLLKKNLESKKLGKMAKRIILVKERRCFAFCLGIRNAKIYISSGLIERLSREEIRAVLEHEQYHLDSHDTATLIIASVAHSLFPFFPLIADLIKRYLIDREIKADNYAINILGERHSLVSALKKVLANNSDRRAFLYAAFADYETLEARICSLIGKKYMRESLSIKNLFISLISVFFLVIITAIPVKATEINHENHNVLMICADGSDCKNSCTSGQNLDKLYSEMQTFTPAQ